LVLIKTEEVEDIKQIEKELKIKFKKIEIEMISEEKVSPLISINMNMGIAQGFTKSNLAEFLEEEAGMNISDIKNVDVKEGFSTFDVSERFKDQIFINLKGYKLFHRNLKLNVY